MAPLDSAQRVLKRLIRAKTFYEILKINQNNGILTKLTVKKEPVA